MGAVFIARKLPVGRIVIYNDGKEIGQAEGGSVYLGGAGCPATPF